MTENLLNANESRSTHPVKSLVKSVSVRLVLDKISRTDFDLITTMVKNSVGAFDSSIETTTGERFNCSVVISLEKAY